MQDTQSEKVFIYNGDGTSEYCVSDTKEFFTRYDVFQNRDVVYSDFSQNLDGLNHATFVVPGGNAVSMAKSFGQFEAIKNCVDDRGFNYIGICAGAYLATTEICLFSQAHKISENTQEFKPPQSIDYWIHGFRICAEYSSIGCFRPNDQYKNYEPKNILHCKKSVPYQTKLSLSETGEELMQLYVEGCGFKKNSCNKENRFETVATYSEKNSFTFFYPKTGETKEILKLDAMIRRKEKITGADMSGMTIEGGIFLSGTHFESCVENSKLIKFFSRKTINNIKVDIQENDEKNLLDSQEKTRKIIVPLLKETFSRQC